MSSLSATSTSGDHVHNSTNCLICGDILLSGKCNSCLSIDIKAPDITSENKCPCCEMDQQSIICKYCNCVNEELCVLFMNLDLSDQYKVNKCIVCFNYIDDAYCCESCGFFPYVNKNYNLSLFLKTYSKHMLDLIQYFLRRPPAQVQEKAPLKPEAWKNMKILHFDEERFRNEKCQICLSRFKHEEKIVIMKKCKKIYHFECIEKWFRINNSCPNCRHILDETSEKNSNFQNSNQHSSDSPPTISLSTSIHSILLNHGDNFTDAEFDLNVESSNLSDLMSRGLLIDPSETGILNHPLDTSNASQWTSIVQLPIMEHLLQ